MLRVHNVMESIKITIQQIQNFQIRYDKLEKIKNNQLNISINKAELTSSDFYLILC